MRLLFAEDDETVGRATSASLRSQGFVVDLIDNKDDALHSIRTNTYDAGIFDICLQDGSGLDALADARRLGWKQPVLLLTALGSVEDRVRGLNAGADDYLVKPFSIDELVARMRALQRRSAAPLTMEITVGNIVFHPATRTMNIDGIPIPLSRGEGIVIEKLLRNLGRVLTKEQIAESIYSFNEDYSQNAVEVYIHRVRRKLESNDAGLKITTIRGIGYIMSDIRKNQ